MKQVVAWIRVLCVGDDAATMVEYGIILFLVVAACMGIVAAIGGQIQAGFNNATAAF